ncbi:MAG TPA: hypothetical protein PKA95_18960, partial [Thermomicrobiales bacterium]|nr:hypothetical protein [Thermomicrobiales bacterium]
MDRQRILVVEDEAELAEALRFNLDRQGYETDAVGNGYTAVCGCQVRAGCRQSMPSSSIES